MADAGRLPFLDALNRHGRYEWRGHPRTPRLLVDRVPPADGQQMADRVDVQAASLAARKVHSDQPISPSLRILA
jgi:hypothetical protein